MNGHDLTQLMLAGLIALNVWQLKLHLRISSDISALRARQQTLWDLVFKTHHRP